MQDREEGGKGILREPMRRFLEDQPAPTGQSDDALERVSSDMSDMSGGCASVSFSRSASQMSAASGSQVSSSSNRPKSLYRVTSAGSQVSNASSLWSKVRDKLKGGLLNTSSMTQLEGLRQSEFEDRRGRKANGVEEICMQAVRLVTSLCGW
eukprot:2387406-Rhodomonas_salina.1